MKKPGRCRITSSLKELRILTAFSFFSRDVSHLNDEIFDDPVDRAVFVRQPFLQCSHHSVKQPVNHRSTDRSMELLINEIIQSDIIPAPVQITDHPVELSVNKFIHSDIIPAPVQITDHSVELSVNKFIHSDTIPAPVQIMDHSDIIPAPVQISHHQRITQWNCQSTNSFTPTSYLHPFK